MDESGRVEMIVKMQVTPAQGLALQAMFEHYNRLSGLGGSRNVAFYADGDGNFHPKAEVSFSEEMPELTDEMVTNATTIDADENWRIDFDPIAWMLPD